MRQAIINGRWNLWVTDSIADWDAITGDASLGTGWEADRLQSMQENLSWGDIVYDIGTEHAWLAAIIAREFVGPQSMVLMEPSPEFWPNIYQTWVYNGFNAPLGTWPGFVGAETSEGWRQGDASVPGPLWPSTAYGPETGAMAYRHLNTNFAGIPTTTVDDYAAVTGYHPKALNIDVEGAELLVLQGARKWMEDAAAFHRRFIWVSVHWDLLPNFGHSMADFAALREEWSDHWDWEHINTDHEAHWIGWSH